MSADDFKGLPIEELISAPLIAAATSQAKLAMVTADFIKNVGIKSDNSGIQTVDFRYIDQDEKGDPIEKKLEVPLLSIINVPSLSVKEVDIEFTMEVKAQTRDESSSQNKVGFEAGFSSKFSPWSCKMTGEVTTKSENTRSTDKSAKYDVKVKARDDGPPEGLSRVLNMLNDAVTNKRSGKPSGN